MHALNLRAYTALHCGIAFTLLHCGALHCMKLNLQCNIDIYYMLYMYIGLHWASLDFTTFHIIGQSNAHYVSVYMIFKIS